MTAKYQFIATAQRELFALVAEELRSFGIVSLYESRKGVHFEGTLEQAYRACLWSRVANRIWLPLTEAEVSTAESLYEAVRSIEWLEHMAPDGTLAVNCHVHRSELQHSHYAALKTKDAIVDYFRDDSGVRPSVETEHPDLRVRVDIVRNQAQIGIDLSGSGLHRRGYRKEGATAPLRETLAAAILFRSQWAEIAAAGGNFVDPMCGSGTLLIEAALMAADIAPGGVIVPDLLHLGLNTSDQEGNTEKCAMHGELRIQGSEEVQASRSRPEAMAGMSWYRNCGNPATRWWT